ncbi:hypothetical protein ACLB2K_054131 [Fragaria x ananassa]
MRPGEGLLRTIPGSFRMLGVKLHRQQTIPSQCRTCTCLCCCSWRKNKLLVRVESRKRETRPLILVEAKMCSDDQTIYSILVQNAETVALVCPKKESGGQKSAIPVTSLKVGDEVFLRLQGGARHTGIEIQEFIVEK